ncbi:MAG TPA: AGE family epimerase/isomerase [Candidatus Acidoferrales bacterium]|nr:AGE family epimerase/isomerase [Candidatus Acidoferrales bacterium]
MNSGNDTGQSPDRNSIHRAAVRLRKWAIEQALPLWANAGFDRKSGRFEERLSLSGQPVFDVQQRLMVQARQIYSYGLAARRGWHARAATLLAESYASMIRDYQRSDGRDGWVFSVHRDGSVADSRRDLYAHAFVLLAVASYIMATGRREALAVADEILDFLDQHMAAPLAGGYIDAFPAVDALRRQNPHMHMLEGLLSLWTSSGEERYLARAKNIFELFARHFFLPGYGVLAEYFDPGLNPAEGVKGRIVEPGHHYEWIWLLRWLETAGGCTVQAYVDALYRHADAYGYDAQGLVVDELLSDGTIHTRSRRAWTVTEAIKANLVEAARGRPGAAGKAASMVDRLHDYFLTKHPPGGWIDRLDEDGRPATDFMPASTLYHILCALDELDRFDAECRS